MNFFQFSEFPDIWLDALVFDKDQQLLFLSAWGNEAVIRQFQARLSLPANDPNSTRRLLLVTKGCVVNFSDPRRFDSMTAKPIDSPFLSLTHVWVFDKAVREWDYAKRCGWVLIRNSESRDVINQKIWQVILRSSPLPLLSAWDHLLHDFVKLGFVRVHPGFEISAWEINLDEQTLSTFITEKLAHGLLSLPN